MSGNSFLRQDAPKIFLKFLENADPSPLNTNIPNTPLISRFTGKVTDDRPIQGHHEWLRQVTKKSKKERYIRFKSQIFTISHNS